MICIFCLRESSPSEEHVFPLAVGGRLTIDRVCSKCNSDLGTAVDAKLSNHPLCVVRRDEFDLRGNSGQKPNGLRALFQAGGVLAAQPSQRVKIDFDPRTGRMSPRLLYDRQERPGDKIVISVDERDKGSIPKIIEAELKRHPGRGRPSSISITASMLENPEVIFSIDIGTVDFSRALSKIAYETAWRYLGDAWLQDSHAKKLRAFVRHGTEGARGVCGIGLENMPATVWGQRHTHVAFVLEAHGKLAAWVKVFDLFSAALVISDHASHYKPDATRAFVEIDVTARKVTQSSFEDALHAHLSRPSS